MVFDSVRLGGQLVTADLRASHASAETNPALRERSLERQEHKMILQLDEIVPGLVSHLDPAVLDSFGVYSPLPFRQRVAGIHPFVCLHVAGNACAFAALSSSSNFGRRVMLPRSAKAGRGAWMERDTFIYGDGQWFYGPCYVFQEASECERTPIRARNSVSDSGLLLVRKVVNFYPLCVAW